MSWGNRSRSTSRRDDRAVARQEADFDEHEWYGVEHPSRSHSPHHQRLRRRSNSFTRSHDGTEDLEGRPPSSGFDEEIHTSRRPSGRRIGSAYIPEWPPQGFTPPADMTAKEAEDYICSGASIFHGYCEVVPHTNEEHTRFYASAVKRADPDTDKAAFQNETFKNISLRLMGTTEATKPWETLEQPSMAFCFGRIPGTVCLNYWIGISGSIYPFVEAESNVKPRKPGLMGILDRLRWLERGLDDDDDLLYKDLYDNLIYDTDKKTNPHFSIDRQISDLITVLSRRDWIDFSHESNQVVAKFFTTKNQMRYHQFFFQLLLAVELHLRMQCSGDWAKTKILPQLPPKIAWDLAVAQRWLENMAIERPRTSDGKSSINFKLLNKRRQIDALRNFAWTLKWPNMPEVEYILKEQDPKEVAVEDRSADAMSWFTGVVLPGKSMSWLIMNTLIDCDRDTNALLSSLTHIYPNSGFQYRANTYWSWECIVGKVLGAAKGVKQIAGWIGPCHYSPDLKRIEIARVTQRALSQKLLVKDVESMELRSDPLGAPDHHYPVEDYELINPDMNEVTEDIRLQKLAFNLSADNPRNMPASHPDPLIFDASIIFALKGQSYPLALTYDVSFITAFPCHFGPHVLFYDYEFETVRIADLPKIENWGNCERRAMVGPEARRARDEHFDYNDIKKVLLIEAFGAPDNEVFARAWCARWGLSAITGNVYKTCVACAVREAYAACVSVVIFTEGRQDDEVEEVDRRERDEDESTGTGTTDDQSSSQN